MLDLSSRSLYVNILANFLWNLRNQSLFLKSLPIRYQLQSLFLAIAYFLAGNIESKNQVSDRLPD
ncbi:hypothetical protein [Planktothricoides sp. SR001]|uniref:hypothetical protein n=1 Tax=Planktothricoides sp. SR001 TaxID=1705388 RepID=UPI0012E14105|nr:hypothetical protein [Planktothricoides sp. SR001]